MKFITLSAAVAATFVFAHSAQAREHHRHHVLHREASNYRHHRRMYDYAPQGQDVLGAQQGFAGGWNYSAQANAYQATAYNGAVGRRPAAWCGWEMRQLVGSDPGPSYNLARNWAHWGRSGPAGVGAVVVWSHHVGKIVGQQNGQWVVQSGNDGHAVRTRVRSIAGAIAIRWG